MRASVSTPCVLALGGLDPGGGAGILADARAIERAGAFPCAVAVVLTVQSTRGVVRVENVEKRTWVEQARRVLDDQRVRVIKTGALGSAENVRATAKLLATHDARAVVDPVMLPTLAARSRSRLLDAPAIASMRRELVPRATLVMANVAEAEALTELPVKSLDGARAAARALVAMGARAALVKGGHLSGTHAVDVLVTKKELVEVSAPRLRLSRRIHGGGCVLASLAAGRLALGDDVVSAVRFAKRVHRAMLARALDVGGDLDVLRAR